MSAASALAGAANAMKGGLAGSTPLTRRVRAIRLYRNGLRCLESWTMDRSIFNAEAIKLRARFDAVSATHSIDSAAALYAIEEGEKELADHEHPDRYVLPYLPGGTKFMRNAPPPVDITNGEEVPTPARTRAQTRPCTLIWFPLVCVNQPVDLFS